MRRVVITGIGIVSSIGNDVETVAQVAEGGPLRHLLRPRVRRARLPLPGARASPTSMPAEHVDKRDLRFMGDGAAFDYIAMQQAIADAGLEEREVSNERTGLITGSGGPSTRNMFEAHRTVIEKGSPKRMGPFMVTRCMSSTSLGLPRDAVPDQGDQLLDHLGLLDQRRTASATASSRSSSASRTSSSPAAARSSTGRSRACSTPWGR